MTAEHLIKEGEVRNPNGRPVGSGRKISKMKRIANRLEEMARTQALGIIQKSLNGEALDKEQLATAKWTVTAAQAAHKMVLQEEDIIKAKDNDGENPVVEEDEKQKATVFSLVMRDKE